jgi:hypothetical protein
MFHTYDFWHDEKHEALIGSLFGSPGLRTYRCFEVPINSRIFHIDAVLTGGRNWRRYIFNDLDDVLLFLHHDAIDEAHISIQSQRVESSDYSIRHVKQILEVRESGCEKAVRIFVYADGTKEADSFSGKEIDLTVSTNIIWGSA